MSQITSSTVKKVAYLSRLYKDLPDQLVEKFQSELESVISYINELKEVDTSQVSPTAIIARTNLASLRPDVPPKNPTEYDRIRTNIINNFPVKQGNLLVISTRIVN